MPDNCQNTALSQTTISLTLYPQKESGNLSIAFLTDNIHVFQHVGKYLHRKNLFEEEIPGGGASPSRPGQYQADTFLYCSSENGQFIWLFNLCSLFPGWQGQSRGQFLSLKAPGESSDGSWFPCGRKYNSWHSGNRSDTHRNAHSSWHPLWLLLKSLPDAAGQTGLSLCGHMF